jgi:hypothetical protein
MDTQKNRILKNETADRAKKKSTGLKLRTEKTCR